jgi:hypothetical protein
LKNELGKIHTSRSKFGCRSVNVDDYKHQMENKTGNTEQKSNKSVIQKSFLFFNAKRNQFEVISWKERKRNISISQTK